MSGSWIVWVTAREPQYESLVNAALLHLKDVNGSNLKGGETFVVNGVPLEASWGNTFFGIPNEQTLYLNVCSGYGTGKMNPDCPREYWRLVTLLLWSESR